MEHLFSRIYVACTFAIGIVFWIALAASVRMDYAITEFTFADAVEKAWHMPGASVIEDRFAQPFLWFYISIILAGSVPFLRIGFLRIAAVSIAVIASCLTTNPFTILLGPIFPFYLLTPSNGETWGEAWHAMSAVGFWVLLSLGYVGIQWIVMKRNRRDRLWLAYEGATDHQGNDYQ